MSIDAAIARQRAGLGSLPALTGPLPTTKEPAMACIEDLTDLAHKIRLHLEAERAQGREPVNGRKIVLAVKADPTQVRYALAQLCGGGHVEKVGPAEYRLAVGAASHEGAGEVAPDEGAEVGPLLSRAFTPAPGTLKAKVIAALAANPEGMRSAQVVHAVGSRSAEPTLTDLVKRGMVRRVDGLYTLPAEAPWAHPGTAEVSDGRDALGWQRQAPVVVPVTAAEQALITELAEKRRTDAAVRLLVQASDGEDTEAAVVRHIAAVDLAHQEAEAQVLALGAELHEAQDAVEEQARWLVNVITERDEAFAKEAAVSADLIRVFGTEPIGTMLPLHVVQSRLDHYRNAWCDLAEAVTGTPTDPDGEHGELEVGGILAIAKRLRERADKAERDAFRTHVEAREIRNALIRIRAATDGRLTDLDALLRPGLIADRVVEVAEERWELQERAEVAEARTVRFARLWAGERRRADGLERVASRQPIAAPAARVQGPSLLGPAVAQAAADVACNACARAIAEIADVLGIEETDPARVAGVVKALVDDLDGLGEQVLGHDYDPAEVVEGLRRSLVGVSDLKAEIAAERAGHIALIDHVRTLAGDLAVARAEADVRIARGLSRSLRGEGTK